MEVKVGQIAATCPICRHADFVSRHKRLKSMDVLACAKCATKFTYVFLLDQIARKSIANSDDAIEAARKRREQE